MTAVEAGEIPPNRLILHAAMQGHFFISRKERFFMDWNG